MSIATAGKQLLHEQRENLPRCRFPLPPNLVEFSAGNVPAIQPMPGGDASSAERDGDRLLNARQVAERLGVSERWVRDHTTRRSPRIRGVKLGMMMRYRRADVDLFMQELGT